ncbi:olfactory receptor 10AD1-like [Cavia porcellus]|uniref:olfactory receptor 10AD1-like n=1 Tax=Cavia porcellus TaxID=10141 RepID=UPI002FE21441
MVQLPWIALSLVGPRPASSITGGPPGNSPEQQHPSRPEPPARHLISDRSTLCRERMLCRFLTVPHCAGSAGKVGSMVCGGPQRRTCAEPCGPHIVELRNSSTVTEFILVGFEQSSPSTQALLFTLFLALYSLAMAMNGLIIFITWTDPRLNSPIYFFLGHLSFLDVCFITTTIPQMLVHLAITNHTVSFASCLTQMYLVFGVGVAECILLAFMAYDRYAAICHPLSYAQIMSWKICVRLVSTAWALGMINGILLDYMTFRGPFCRDNHIENFFCEAPIVINLSCGDPQFSLMVIFVDAIVVLLSPMVLIVTSYARILTSILGRTSSSSGRGKTFSTCASHLTVVIFFYTSAMFSYMNPRSTHGPEKDKPFSLLYTIITPMCNPIIYSLRNKEMKGAMVRAFRRTTVAQAESV